MRDHAAKRMSQFCIATRVSPTEYKKLTLAEYQAFVETLEEMNKQ
jgi:hypothetical protein